MVSSILWRSCTVYFWHWYYYWPTIIISECQWQHEILISHSANRYDDKQHIPLFTKQHNIIFWCISLSIIHIFICLCLSGMVIFLTTFDVPSNLHWNVIRIFWCLIAGFLFRIATHIYIVSDLTSDSMSITFSRLVMTCLFFPQEVS